MSKEKQIEEMSAEIREVVNGCSSYWSGLMAEHLFEQGYRKQSEGRWEKRVFVIFDSEKVGYRCSECNTTWDTQTPYCSNCGAKMKGGEE